MINTYSPRYFNGAVETSDIQRNLGVDPKWNLRLIHEYDLGILLFCQYVDIANAGRSWDWGFRREGANIFCLRLELFSAFAGLTASAIDRFYGTGEVQCGPWSVDEEERKLRCRPADQENIKSFALASID
jgi:hypothetical protein